MGAYSTAFPGGKPITSENAKELLKAYGFFPYPTSRAFPRWTWWKPRTG